MNSKLFLITVFYAVLVQALGIPPSKSTNGPSNRTTTSSRSAPRQLLIWPDPTIPISGFDKRQEGQVRCGSIGGGAACAKDECCSAAGWCGTGYDYCSAPACQINFGPACDANTRPQGPNTENTPRPHKGSVPYGRGIFNCEKSGAVALTFDDGPFEYTSVILDLLQEYGAKATFFVTGNNLGKGAINNGGLPWRALIQRMINNGHQVGSHTWGHQRLTDLTEDQVRRQMIYNEVAIADVLDKFPTYMRPPYSASSDAVDSVLGRLGYHVTYFDLDTEGYLHNEPREIQRSKNIWDANVEGRPASEVRFLQIEHDIVYQAAYNLTEYFLKSLKRNGLRSITVGDCLNDPSDNWYRDVSGGGGNGNNNNNNEGEEPRDDKTAEPPKLPASTDGRCGADQGDQTCYYEAGATCCSRRGWCGNTGDHCGGGCQAKYGTCGWSN